MANETIIAYNGETIATLEAGQTATIKAAEYEFDHDLVFKAGSGGGGSGGGGGITASATSRKSEIRYVSTQVTDVITITATVSVA